MSMENYLKAVEIIKQNENECYFVGPRSENDISLAEKALGITFTGIYREFLKSYGAGSFGAEEIYGISSLNFENSTVPNGIWYTLLERKEFNLPHNLLVIYHSGGEEMFCLDFNKIDNSGEPAVVSYAIDVDLKHQTYEVVANDFGEFFLQRVKIEFGIL